MSKAGYDVAIPGNHEFDYGMENFLEIAGNSTFPYICCNLMKDGETVLEPYMIFDKGGKKIAFIGVTTPRTITSSTPKYFQDENGNFIYDFLQVDKTGQAVYDAIQKSADNARAEGADYVILLGHLGMYAADKPWDYASVAANTSGIDAILDGHSHDSDQVTVKNNDGAEIPRSACGTKLKSIGWLRISGEDGSLTTGLYNWSNDVSATELLGLDNDMSKAVAAAMEDVDKQLAVVIGKTTVDLTIFDPKTVTDEGQPVRLVRRAETNLADLVTDSYVDTVLGTSGVKSPIKWLQGAEPVQGYIARSKFNNVGVISTALAYINDLYFLNVDWGKRLSELHPLADYVIVNVGSLDNVVHTVLYNTFTAIMRGHIIVKATPINLRTAILHLTGLGTLQNSLVSCVEFAPESQTFYAKLSSKFNSQILTAKDTLSL